MISRKLKLPEQSAFGLLATKIIKMLISQDEACQKAVQKESTLFIKSLVTEPLIKALHLSQSSIIAVPPHLAEVTEKCPNSWHKY